MPLAPIALFESGLLQECRGNHADAQARFDVVTRFGDPRMRARLTEVRWALPPHWGDQALAVALKVVASAPRASCRPDVL